MMNIFCAIFVIGTVAALASPAAATSQKDCTDALEKLILSAEELLTQSEKEIQTSLEELNKTAESAKDQWDQELNLKFEPLEVKLLELKNKAKENASEECNLYVSQFKKLQDTNDNEWITKQVTKAQVYADEAIAKAKTIKKDIEDVQEEIEECSQKIFLLNAFCYFKVFSKIAVVHAEAPNRIQLDADLAKNEIAQISSDLGSCSDSELKEAVKEATQILENFEQECVNKDDDNDDNDDHDDDDDVKED